HRHPSMGRPSNAHRRAVKEIHASCVDDVAWRRRLRKMNVKGLSTSAPRLETEFEKRTSKSHRGGLYGKCQQASTGWVFHSDTASDFRQCGAGDRLVSQGARC